MFEKIDPGLRDWAQRRSLHVYTKYRDEDFRSIEVVDEAGSRYQIWVIEQGERKVEVSAWSIDTRETWRGAGDLTKLEQLLDTALSTVDGWIQARGRVRPVS